MIEFQSNNQKANTNLTKHGVSFDEAKTVFYDGRARVISDPEHSDDEDRFIIMGLSSRLRVLVVCHCCREDDDVIRIISARKATRKETDTYREYQ